MSAAALGAESKAKPNQGVTVCAIKQYLVATQDAMFCDLSLHPRSDLLYLTPSLQRPMRPLHRAVFPDRLDPRARSRLVPAMSCL
jgi:hypothetical protein